MLFEIFKFEIKYRAKRPETYLYFIIVLLFAVVAVDFIFHGEELAPLKRNSPYVIARVMGIVSALFMIISSMIMGVPVLRDFEHQMESLLFVNPIKKRDYLLGRFIGSFVVLVGIYCALPLGMMLGDLLFWKESSSLPFHVWAYLQPFVFLILPTLFFGGSIFFVSGALSRKLIVVYTQGFFFLLVYMFAISLAIGADDLFYTALVEPFTFQTLRIATHEWSIEARQTELIVVEGVLLYNRLIWSGIGLVALLIGFNRFQFSTVRARKSGKAQAYMEDERSDQASDSLVLPNPTQRFDPWAQLRQLLHHSIFGFMSVVREVPFWAIVLCGMGTLVLNSFNLGTVHGVNSYPTTFILVGELFELTVLFFLSIIIFYSGELIWKERELKMSGVYDALPMSDFVSFAGKFIGLMMVCALLILTLILAGMIFQSVNGYFKYELDVYLTGFFVEIFPFLFLLSVLSFFFQALINHKFLSHLVVLIFPVVITLPLKLLGWDHSLYSFGGSGLSTYSDMNGYGHSIEGFVWSKVYWISFSIVLLVLASVFIVRGIETSWRTRWHQSKSRMTSSYVRSLSLIMGIFILTGGYIFFNTNILNTYSTSASKIAYRADYEKTLKPLTELRQPTIAEVKMELELYPAARDFTVEGSYLLVNHSNSSIEQIHIQKYPDDQMNINYLEFDRPVNSDFTYDNYGYLIYHLENMLAPGDSILMSFKQTYNTAGFTEGSTSIVVNNGTFLENLHFPTLGYQYDIELDDESDRRTLGLPPSTGLADRMANSTKSNNALSNSDNQIKFEMIISTDSSQTAVTSGQLLDQWIDGSRSFFHYKMNKPMSNFYSVLSAEYQSISDRWSEPTLDNSVDLEIYYHKGHENNLGRMMKGMKSALSYYSENFAPYPYEQLRIVESPIYKNRAQSFPGMISFSEGVGFILDINDEADVDMAFYIAAHEVAHQWWGHLIHPAKVKGMDMLSESLAQYSALMVLKNEYPEEKVYQLLNQQANKYLKRRTSEKSLERPLIEVDSNQEYIYYSKGLVSLFTLHDFISEDSVNSALSSFIKDWNSFDGAIKSTTDNYPTAADLMPYLRHVTPDSLQHVVDGLFETVTLYELEGLEAEVMDQQGDSFEIGVSLDLQKQVIDSVGTLVPALVNDWIEIAVFAKDIEGEAQIIYLKKHLLTSNKVELSITVDQPPYRVRIDPFNKMMIKNAKKNEVRPKVLLN
ncbi:MAG: M1 family aminopeptidase [Reichenbachiella sp.]|uniref:ABC transporter permease/M1 family aminopeptidase n=1 Tax=Reichenbachiella sp. TaxID=2184521 RepID=UPI003262DF4F